MNTRKYSRSLQEAFQDADYASPYCPGESTTSDPWFVQHCRIMDKALLGAAVAAVALLGWSFYLWVLV